MVRKKIFCALFFVGFFYFYKCYLLIYIYINREIYDESVPVGLEPMARTEADGLKHVEGMLGVGVQWP